MSIEAMKLALEALNTPKPEDSYPPLWRAYKATIDNAITALRQAIAEADQAQPVAWRNAAIRIGEDLSSVGPDGYYDMTAKQWLDWAMAQEPRGKTSLNATPPQRKPDPVIDKSAAIRIATALGWTPPRQPLTDEEIAEFAERMEASDPTDSFWRDFARAIEAAHGIKENTFVGLTKKEFQEAVEGLEDLEDCWVAIEAKLRIKNT